MYRITNDNFDEYYPKIEESLKNSSFVAIDAEFSGLSSAIGESRGDQSLFDSPAERYSILRNDIRPFAAIQIGLTTFRCVKNENKYSAECFRFYLQPKAFPTANRTVLYQSSAIEFLTAQNFDFNQLAYDALSYLNEAEEAQLEASLRNSPKLWYSAQFLPVEVQDEIERSWRLVHKWLKESSGEEKVLPISTSNFLVQYFLQKELHESFNEIWTETQSLKSFSVVKVTADVREALKEEEEKKKSLNERLLNYYMGFSRVFKLITKLKKPIVGHNLLLDLMFMHKQFFAPLPKKYEAFKSNINRLFPTVYDTKYISYELKIWLKKETKLTPWKSNGLADLYSYFNDGPGRHCALYSPTIALQASDTEKVEEKFHDAGWDSYCTGYCFIRMSHIFAVNKLSKLADLRVLTNTEIMLGLKDQMNRVNLIRADLSYLRLDSSDPASTRPRWLHVLALAESTGARQIAQAFSRFGPVDVKRHSSKSLLVAVPDHRTAREILKHYENNPDFRVSLYDSWMHSSRRIHVLFWTGSLLLSGLGLAFLLKHEVLPSKPVG